MRDPTGTARQLTDSGEQRRLGPSVVVAGTDFAVRHFKLSRRLSKQHVAAEAEILLDQMPGYLVQIPGMCRTKFALPHAVGCRLQGCCPQRQRPGNDQGASFHEIRSLLDNAVVVERTYR